MIAAIQYLPVMEYVDWSPRAGGKKGWEHAISYSLPPSELINTYLPQFTGMLERYWGVNRIHLHSEYIGAAVMVLAGLAWTRKTDTSTRRLMWWATGMLIVAVLWALGGNTPFYRLVYAIVPGTKFFRAPSIMLYVVQFATAVLAALGAERVIRGDITRRYLIGWAVAATAVALLASGGGLTNLASSIAPAERADAVAANNGALIAGAWRSALFVLLALSVLFLAQRRRVSGLQAAIAFAAVVLLDLWSVERKYWMFMPPATETFAPNDITRYLTSQPQPARVVATELAQAPGRDPYVSGTDGLMVHGIRDALGYHGNQIDRYDVLAGRPTYNQIGNPNFWSLANVQFFLTNNDSLPIPGAVRVMGPVSSPIGTPLYLFTLPGDHPFSWVAPAVVKADDEATTNTVLDQRFNVRQAAIFANDAAVKVQQLTTLPDPLPIETSTSDYKPGHFVIDLNAAAPAGSALIVSENYYPGWSATADGKPVQVWRADMSFMGIELPTGARRLEFNFASKPYETGKLITLIALLLSLGAWVAGAALSRRRGGATSGG
jgi:hypothetical protein